MDNKINHNRCSRLGLGGFDDMEVCQDLGLPTELAYTPKLNIEMLNHAYRKNVEGFRNMGLSESEAQKQAKKIRAEFKTYVKTS